MKQQEFFQQMEQSGIDLNQLHISIGKLDSRGGIHGVYEKDGQWICYSADERNDIHENIMKNEEEAFDKMFYRVRDELQNFTNAIVTKEIADIPKDVICEFIQNKYALSPQQASQAWDYLKQDMHVLFELKYYAAKGAFVPDEFCYKVRGYSAEQLYKTTHLEVLGAFNYLIYLKLKPKEALSNLQKGLPRRTLFSEKEVKEMESTAEKKAAPAVEAEQPQPEPAEEPAQQAEVLEKLEAIQQAVTELQQAFDDKIAQDAHKNGLFDRMHRELTQYQNGAMDKLVETMALDIIQLVDSTKSHVRVYEQKEATKDNYQRLLRIIKGVAEDLQDILYRQNIESYRVTGHEVDIRRQKIIQTVPTDDPTKDNLVAFRVADGYEKGGKVLRPERIKIFKYGSAEAADKKTEQE